MRGKMISEADMLAQALAALQERLPSNWTAAIEAAAIERDSGVDAKLRLTEPGGRSGEVVVEVKANASPRALRSAAERQGAGRRTAAIVVAPYLTQRSRQVLEDARVNYLDLTGNIRLAIDEPPLFLRDRGSDTNPFPAASPERSLAGPLAGRVVLTLLELVPPSGALTLTSVAGEGKVSLPYVSRVVDLLENEDLVRRSPRGPITEVDRPGLVRRWAEDYSLLKSNKGRLFLDPRGAARTLGALDSDEFRRATSGRYAITGSFAASRFAPAVAPPSKLVCFVEYPDTAAEALGLSPATGVGNVLLLAPYDAIVFERVVEGKGLSWATAGQVMVDCLTGPDRMPAEGEALLAYMSRTDQRWRGFSRAGASA